MSADSDVIDVAEVTDEQPVEAAAVELVDRPAPGTDLVAGRDSALVAAAEAALSNPGAPSHDEFWALAAAARILCMSGAAPKAIRQDPHLALHVALVGRDLGISPSAALELVDIIKVRDGEYRLSLSPQLMNGQLRRLGVGCILPMIRTTTECVAVAFGPDGPDRRCTRTGVVAHVEGCMCDVLGSSEFTWEDARIAGLVGTHCQPGDHRQVTRQRQNGGSYQTCGCNQGYVTYPKRMLWWRASGFAADDYFPEAGLGLYSPEALGAGVGPDGRPIDVDSVELPPGYEPPAVGAGGSNRPQERRQAAEQTAPAEELWKLQEQVHALPEGLRQELLQRWMAHAKLRNVHITRVPVNLMATVRSMVNATWAEATKAGADRDTEVQRLQHRLAQCVVAVFWRDAGFTGSPGPVAQEPPAGPPSTDTPAEPATGHTAPPAEPEFDVDGDGNQVPHPEGRAGLVRNVDPEAVDRGPEPDPDGNIPPEPEPVDWRPILRQMSDLVGPLMTELGPAGQRITAAVEKMHHTVINRLIADLEEHPEAFPPESPIGLRRMAVAYLLGTHVQNTGEMPDEVIEAEQK